MKNYWLNRPQQNLGPCDDALTINDILLAYYSYNNQYVQGEMLEGGLLLPFVRVDALCVKYKPVVENAMTGVVYLGNKVIQTFFDKGGKFVFNSLPSAESKVRIIEGAVNKAGELFFVWNTQPGKHHFVVNYEYEYGVE